jgi:hypothetical protein
VTHHGELLAKRQDLEMEPCAASERAYKGSEQRKEDRLHARDAMMVAARKSTESICTGFFLVGTTARCSSQKCDYFTSFYRRI